MKNIVLIGMRVAGKSRLGKKLKDTLGMSLVDIDEYIQEKSNMTIEKIVDQYGWTFFRNREYEAILNFKNVSNTIIVTGAGLPTFERNQKIIKDIGIVVWVKTEEKTLLERINQKSKEHRPSLTGKNIEEEFLDIYKERIPIYKALADFIFHTSKDFQKEIIRLKNLGI